VPDGGSAPRVTAITPAAWDEDGWNRAFDRGHAAGLRAAAVAVVYINEASAALERTRVPRAERKAIWEQALYDVQQEHGDLPQVITRALAARRIAELVRLRAL